MSQNPTQHPDWYNPTGDTAYIVKPKDKQPSSLPKLTIATGKGEKASGQLVIRKSRNGRVYYGRWQLFYDGKKNKVVRVAGELVWNEEDLRGALGKATSDPQVFHAVMTQGGGFCRLGNYLSVPGKGSGQDGDTNMSILVKEIISEAMEKLIAQPTA